MAPARRWPSQAAFGRGRFPALPRPDRWGRPPGSRRRGRRRALRAPRRPPAPRSARGWTARGAPRGRRGPSPLSTQPSASSSGVGLRPNSAGMVANTAWAFATLPPTWTGTRLAVPRSRVPRSRMPRWAFGDRFPSTSGTGTFGAGEAGSFGGPTAYFNCSGMRCVPRCERRCLPRRSAAGRGHHRPGPHGLQITPRHPVPATVVVRFFVRAKPSARKPAFSALPTGTAFRGGLPARSSAAMRISVSSPARPAPRRRRAAAPGLWALQAGQRHPAAAYVMPAAPGLYLVVTSISKTPPLDTT